VVITAGGFATDGISPNNITEVLRILKPDGYLLWTMKTSQADKSTEFGLFEQNLQVGVEQDRGSSLPPRA
jgi:hypothetical protein